MTDAELTALAALVVGYAAETAAANHARLMRGEGVAYDGLAEPAVLEQLRDELLRRGILRERP